VTNPECDTSAGSGDGVCNTSLGRCTAGARALCHSKAACATGRQCLSCDQQAADWAAGFEGTTIEALHRMQTYIDGLNDPTPPILVALGVPMTGGRAGTAGVVVPDIECTGNWPYRRYYDSIARELLASPWFPHRRVATFAAYNRDRLLAPYHADQVHQLKAGGFAIGDEVVSTVLEDLNVCLAADGETPQRYCRRQTGLWSRRCTCTVGTQVADCGTGGVCTPGGVCQAGTAARTTCTADAACNTARVCQVQTCTDDAGCLGTESCIARPCSSCACTVATQVADCGSGGGCDPTALVCTAGTATRVTCNGATQCAAGRACVQTALDCPAAGDTCGAY
jgi:hypothetical protein